MLLVMYRRINNDANGNPRYVIDLVRVNCVEESAENVTSELSKFYKFSRLENGYIITSYNIKEEISGHFPYDEITFIRL